ncbi:MAG: 50S ribosomal protein L28 [Chloroflexi bacterium]|nr:50S ribosomal protein L28 [Chloroflexota bacterium]
MAAGKCEICAKAVIFGRHIRYKHGGNWERKAQKKNRTFAPNVHQKRMFVDGKWQRLNVCTGCLRTEAKHQQAAGVSF